MDSIVSLRSLALSLEESIIKCGTSDAWFDDLFVPENQSIILQIVGFEKMQHYNQLFYLGSLGDGDNVNNPGIRLQQQQQQPRVEQITQPLVLGN